MYWCSLFNLEELCTLLDKDVGSDSTCLRYAVSQNNLLLPKGQIPIHLSHKKLHHIHPAKVCSNSYQDFDFPIFLPTCAFCMVGSYASLSVCLDWTKNHCIVVMSMTFKLRLMHVTHANLRCAHCLRQVAFFMEPH